MSEKLKKTQHNHNDIRFNFYIRMNSNCLHGRFVRINCNFDIYYIYIYLCYIIISIRASFYNLIWSMQITNEMKFYESMINARKKKHYSF